MKSNIRLENILDYGSGNSFSCNELEVDLIIASFLEGAVIRLVDYSLLTNEYISDFTHFSKLMSDRLVNAQCSNQHNNWILYANIIILGCMLLSTPGQENAVLG